MCSPSLSQSLCLSAPVSVCLSLSVSLSLSPTHLHHGFESPFRPVEIPRDARLRDRGLEAAQVLRQREFVLKSVWKIAGMTHVVLQSVIARTPQRPVGYIGGRLEREMIKREWGSEMSGKGEYRSLLVLDIMCESLSCPQLNLSQ